MSPDVLVYWLLFWHSFSFGVKLANVQYKYLMFTFFGDDEGNDDEDDEGEDEDNDEGEDEQ